MKEVIVLGWVNEGKLATDGESAKNQLLIRELRKYCKVMVMDFYHWKRHPWIILQFLFALIVHPQASLVLSTSFSNIIPLVRIFKTLRVKKNIIHWVIGGRLHERVKSGEIQSSLLNYFSFNLVESQYMADSLTECGVTNALYVPNFKPIDYLPLIPKKTGKTKFVFISRIMPEKGVDYILDAVKLLIDSGYKGKFLVDFYGRFAPSYKDIFDKKIQCLECVNYCGLLDFQKKEGYNKLSSYHVMLFPTYWQGEGFAGVFMDAFIAGLPIIASDWGQNLSIVKDGETSIVIPVHSVEALKNAMEQTILGKYDLDTMSKKCRAEAFKYNSTNVINETLLSKLKIC